MDIYEEILKNQIDQRIHILKSIGNDIEKSIPEKQDAINPIIEKAISDGLITKEDIEKARSGVYTDTPENRKLGRVGQKYGSKKEPEKKAVDTKQQRISEIVSEFKNYKEFSRIRSYNETEEVDKKTFNKLISDVFGKDFISRDKYSNAELGTAGFYAINPKTADIYQVKLTPPLGTKQGFAYKGFRLTVAKINNISKEDADSGKFTISKEYPGYYYESKYVKDAAQYSNSNYNNNFAEIYTGLAELKEDGLDKKIGLDFNLNPAKGEKAKKGEKFTPTKLAEIVLGSPVEDDELSDSLIKLFDKANTVEKINDGTFRVSVPGKSPVEISFSKDKVKFGSTIWDKDDSYEDLVGKINKFLK